MKRFIFYLSSLILYVSAAQAQPFNPANGEAGTSYFRLCSAHPAHLGTCIEDFSANGASAYTYRITAPQQANAAQEWQLVATGQEGCYLLCNRQTGRFISRQGHFVQGAWTLLSQPEETACAFTVTDIGDGQYALSFIDQEMKTRYLCVADSAQQHFDTFSTLASRLKGSRWAWHIKPADAEGSGVQQTAGMQVRVSVHRRRIHVQGTDAYQVTDLQGRLVDRGGAAHPTLPAGIYLVQHSGGCVRVAVN